MFDKCEGAGQLRILYIYDWIFHYISSLCFHPYVSLTHVWPKVAHQANVNVGKAARELLQTWKQDVNMEFESYAWIQISHLQLLRALFQHHLVYFVYCIIRFAYGEGHNLLLRQNSTSLIYSLHVNIKTFYSSFVTKPIMLYLLESWWGNSVYI